MQPLLATPPQPLDLIGSSRRQIDDSRKLIREVMGSTIGASRARVLRTEARLSRSLTLLLESGSRTTRD